MKRMNHLLELAALLGGALLTGLTLIFPVIGFLQWVSMIPMIWAAYRLGADPTVKLRHAYGYGFLTVFAYYFVLYHWFVSLYPLDFAGLDNAASLVVVLAGWIGLSLLQAIVGGLIFLAFRALHKTDVMEKMPLLRPFVFAALWVVFEWTSTLSWTGVPWGRLALGQIDYLPMLQSASLFGSYFVSFLILSVNGLLAYMLYRRARSWLCIGLAAGILVGNLSFGLIARAVQKDPESPVTVAVIQGNISSKEKWGVNTLAGIQSTYAALTREAAEKGAELALWPETVLPYSVNERSSVKRFLSDLAKECEITLAVGAFYTAEDGAEYNALYFVDPDGTFREEFYAKRHLVPFGEYVPMKKIIETVIPPLSELVNLGGSLTAGEGSAIMESEVGRLGSLICFDSIYEQLALESTRDGAELFLVSTNDSWFFDSAGVYQHQSQSQLRAIECGRYFVRSANTGISTVISPDGELLAWIDPLERGYAVAEVEPTDTRTLYSVIGNTFVYLCIAGVAALAGVGIWRKYKKRENQTDDPLIQY